MKYCTECGGKLSPVETSKDSWSAIYKCPKGHRFEVTYGDAMGGSLDDWRRLRGAK